MIKTDCIVLDFGTASLKHGSLEQEADLDGFETDDEAQTKTRPECDAEAERAFLEQRLAAQSALAGGQDRRSPF